jgi:excisionase family DNA binding protein
MTGPEFLTVAETAAALRISGPHAYRMIADGRIPVTAWGTRKLVPARWVHELAEQTIADFSKQGSAA